MPVIVITCIPALTAEAYDETGGRLAGSPAESDGLIAHAVAADADGITITELWEAETDWQRFREVHGDPNMPAGLASPTVVELQSSAWGWWSRRITRAAAVAA